MGCCQKYCRISSIFRPPGCQNPNNFNGLLKKGPLNTLSTTRFNSQAVDTKCTAAKYCP